MTAISGVTGKESLDNSVTDNGFRAWKWIIFIKKRLKAGDIPSKFWLPGDNFLNFGFIEDKSAQQSTENKTGICLKEYLGQRFSAFYHHLPLFAAANIRPWAGLLGWLLIDAQSTPLFYGRYGMVSPSHM